jgi:hypothetical protein
LPKVVGGRDEEHVREVVLHIEEMVDEVPVLLRIEHLEQSRRRITAVVGGELVDLVEQDDRVDRPGLLHGSDHAAGHRADVGATVTADLSLVANAAETDPDKLAVHRAGDRSPEACLADTGRSGQAEDLRNAETDLVTGLAQLAHGQEVEDALLDVLETVMVLVEDLLGDFEVEAILTLVRPGQADHRVDIGANDGCLGRDGRHPFESQELATELLCDLIRHATFGDLATEIVHLAAAISAELVVDRLELFAQVVLALVLFDLVADAVLDALFERGNIEVALDETGNADEALVGLDLFEELLALGGVREKLGREQIGEMPGIARALDHVQHFVGELVAGFGVGAGELGDVLHERPAFLDRRLNLSQFFGGDVEERSRRVEGGQADPTDALEHDLQRRCLLPLALDDLCQRTDVIDVTCQWVIDVRIAVSDNDDAAIPVEGFLNGLDRPRSADQERHDVARENDDVLERQQGIASSVRFIARHKLVLNRSIVACNNITVYADQPLKRGTDDLQAGGDSLISLPAAMIPQTDIRDQGAHVTAHHKSSGGFTYTGTSTIPRTGDSSSVHASPRVAVSISTPIPGLRIVAIWTIEESVSKHPDV